MSRLTCFTGETRLLQSAPVGFPTQRKADWERASQATAEIRWFFYRAVTSISNQPLLHETTNFGATCQDVASIQYLPISSFDTVVTTWTVHNENEDCSRDDIFYRFSLARLSLWPRANARNVSHCLFHGVYYPQPSTHSWYTSFSPSYIAMATNADQWKWRHLRISAGSHGWVAELTCQSPGSSACIRSGAAWSSVSSAAWSSSAAPRANWLGPTAPQAYSSETFPWQPLGAWGFSPGRAWWTLQKRRGTSEWEGESEWGREREWEWEREKAQQLDLWKSSAITPRVIQREKKNRTLR